MVRSPTVVMGLKDEKCVFHMAVADTTKAAVDTASEMNVSQVAISIMMQCWMRSHLISWLPSSLRLVPRSRAGWANAGLAGKRVATRDLLTRYATLPFGVA